MELNGIIICNGFCKNAETDWHVARFIEEFEKRGVSLKRVNNDLVNVYIEKTDAKALIKADFAIYWDKDVHIARMLEHTGIKLFNSARAIEITDDKMRTHIELIGSGIKMPKTVSSPLYYGGEDNGDFLDSVLNVLSFPIIVKENFGSFGRQVYLIRNKEQLFKIREELREKPHIYQEYIDEEIGQDTRVMVIGDKVVAAMKRRGEDFRSNIGANGIGENVKISVKLAKTAIKAAKILGLDTAGVDFLKGKDGEPILCEVNSNARFFELERVTKINYAGLYADYIINKVKFYNK